MPFENITNSLAPIRLLRHMVSVTDGELAQMLAVERETKLHQAKQEERWVDVVDLRRFDGVTPSQRQMCAEWLVANAELVVQVSLGVALTVPPGLESRARRFTDQLDRLGVPTRITNDLDSALHWALDLVYDDDVVVDPALVIEGIDAFRLTIS